MYLGKKNKNVSVTGSSHGLGLEVAKHLLEEGAKVIISSIGREQLARAKSYEYQETLLWMLSDASSYLNDTIIPLEGGRTAW